MKGKIFLIHWKDVEAAEYTRLLQEDGWSVNFEAEDGSRACQQITKDPPNVVLIYLNRLPSHGRRTGEHLRKIKVTRDLPIIFVDGNEHAVEKTKEKVPNAILATTLDLERILSNFAHRS